ncbi:hypothetical protein HNQ77_003466 [Silvibacterium bohemicum]|uniref:Uncharacterized protein n=1 Tax=Silvibacterium bohemicum TaxID=1577686 RepID=A0A841JY15_9BACT|nr:hypothetical protein [Silvibacterium bohemicum]MBB6145505.1 hypothetical protein [Silvibacterium bohemicum]
MDVRERLKRRQVTGLLVIAALIAIFALWRAAPHSVFAPGWWRFW